MTPIASVFNGTLHKGDSPPQKPRVAHAHPGRSSSETPPYHARSPSRNPAAGNTQRASAHGQVARLQGCGAPPKLPADGKPAERYACSRSWLWLRSLPLTTPSPLMSAMLLRRVSISFQWTVMSFSFARVCNPMNMQPDVNTKTRNVRLTAKPAVYPVSPLTPSILSSIDDISSGDGMDGKLEDASAGAQEATGDAIIIAEALTDAEAADRPRVCLAGARRTARRASIGGSVAEGSGDGSVRVRVGTKAGALARTFVGWCAVAAPPASLLPACFSTLQARGCDLAEHKLCYSACLTTLRARGSEPAEYNMVKQSLLVTYAAIFAAGFGLGIMYHHVADLAHSAVSFNPDENVGGRLRSVEHRLALLENWKAAHSHDTSPESAAARSYSEGAGTAAKSAAAAAIAASNAGAQAVQPQRRRRRRTQAQAQPDGCPAGRKPYHVVLTAQDSPYQAWQTRIMYYHLKKLQMSNPCTEITGFTRLLSSPNGALDALADEIPTVTATALSGGQACRGLDENSCDMGFPVMNRPHAITQFLAKLPASLTEEYVLIAETDHVFMSEPPNRATPDKPACFPFGYMDAKAATLRPIVSRFVDDPNIVDPCGPSPVLIHLPLLRKLTPEWCVKQRTSELCS